MAIRHPGLSVGMPCGSHRWRLGTRRQCSREDATCLISEPRGRPRLVQGNCGGGLYRGCCDRSCQAIQIRRNHSWRGARDKSSVTPFMVLSTTRHRSPGQLLPHEGVTPYRRPRASLVEHQAGEVLGSVGPLHDCARSHWPAVASRR